MSARAIRALTPYVRHLRTLGAKALLLRLIIGHREDQPLRCCISELARELGCKRETVRAAFDELARLGHAQVIDGLVILRIDDDRPVNQAGEITPEGARIQGEGVATQRPPNWPVSGQKLASERPPSKEERKINARLSAREEIGYLTGTKSRVDADFSRLMLSGGFHGEAVEIALRDARSALAQAEARREVPAWLEKAGEVDRLFWAWRQFQRGLGAA